MMWPKELVDDIARRRAVLYIGAGVSASASSPEGSSPPGWNEFLTIANSKLERRVPSETVKQLMKESDFLTACELLKNALDESWSEVLKDQFLTPRFESSPVHKALHDLDLPIVLTPNFDSIYDRFALTETSGTTVVKNYWDDDLPLMLRRKYRAVIKVHGSIDEPSKMIFSRGDYANLRVKYRHFFELVRALFVTNTFLFVGTSLSDPDLRLFLENFHYSHPESPPHYMTSPIGEISKHLDDSVRRNMNIKLVRYSPEDRHIELTTRLEGLVQKVGAARVLLGEADSW